MLKEFITSNAERGGSIMAAAKELNNILVGRKPAMSYVLAVVTCFNTPNIKEVTLKARGRAISTAVDVAEIVKRRFLKDLKVSKIQIGTEELQMKEGGTRSVSTIELTLTL
jgi:DNA-binding protein